MRMIVMSCRKSKLGYRCAVVVVNRKRAAWGRITVGAPLAVGAYRLP